MGQEGVDPLGCEAGPRMARPHRTAARRPWSLIPRATWAKCWSISTMLEDGLLPDTNVTVTVTISSEPNALSMPREALHEQNGKYFVYKVVGNELKRVPVTIGSPTLTQVPILSGLEDGEWWPPGPATGSPCRRAYRSRKSGERIANNGCVAFGACAGDGRERLSTCAQIPAATLTQANTDLQAGRPTRRLPCLRRCRQAALARTRRRICFAACGSSCSSGARQ